MKRHMETVHESIKTIGISMEALLGCLASAGILAIILRIASGKW